MRQLTRVAPRSCGSFVTGENREEESGNDAAVNGCRANWPWVGRSLVTAASELLSDLHRSETVFTVRKLKYGGYEVLEEGDDPDTPRRHVCDFRSEYEAKTWIKENAVIAARRLAAR